MLVDLLSFFPQLFLQLWSALEVLFDLGFAFALLTFGPFLFWVQSLPVLASLVISSTLF